LSSPHLSHYFGNGWKSAPFCSTKRTRMSDEILTALEVATLLKVADMTVYTMAQKGQTPSFEVRGQGRFRRVDIDAWIQAQTTAPRRPGDGDV
jgi:excisionase family DNA binding protein